jgi:valyl-tRNA synthetase
MKIYPIGISKKQKKILGSALTDDKKAVYNTTFEVLKGVCLLAAPFAPYLPELLPQLNRRSKRAMWRLPDMRQFNN